MQPDWEQTRALVRRLRWTVIEPLARRPNGDERSRLVGPGVEFASVREYQPGDDVRCIDWNLTARLNTPYVREAQAEGALDVWLAVDVSGSVDWGTAECLKRYRAVELAAVTGQLLGRHANRLGLLLFADRPVGLIPPGQGRMHLDRLISTLRLHPRSAARGATDLTGALEHLDRLARRTGWISRGRQGTACAARRHSSRCCARWPAADQACVAIFRRLFSCSAWGRCWSVWHDRRWSWRCRATRPA